MTSEPPPSDPEPIFTEPGASWLWVLLGPIAAGAMILVQRGAGVGFQPLVPLMFLVLVSGVLTIQVKAARIHTSVELTRDALREGTETILISEIVTVFPAGPTCGAPTDCASGTCASGKCVLACPSTACETGFTCNAGACEGNPECVISGDCQPGEFCVFGGCVAPKMCAKNKDCDPGQFCVFGFCAAGVECADHTDCPAGEGCFEGACTAVP